MKVYLASGWFSPEQEIARMAILTTVKKFPDFDLYSPKDDCLYEPDITDPQEVFDENIQQINDSDFIIASTVEKDMGTIFECGFAHANNIPIVYYWPNPIGKFNLMLSQTGHAVLHNKQELNEYLQFIDLHSYVPIRVYGGGVE